jgi:hypothetical protein
MPSRLLVAVGAAAENPDQIPDGVRLLLEAADEILVLSPALPDRVHWLVSDTDKARSAADERLATVLGHLDEVGQTARGEAGADDPVLAFADAVDEFHPDHIVIGLRGSAEADWQEQGLVEKIFERFRLPITVFSI